MQIIIDKDYALAANSSCWMIQKAKISKGERFWEAIKWFGTIEGAIKELADLKLRTSDCTTFAESLEFNKITLSGIVRALAPDIEVTVK